MDVQPVSERWLRSRRASALPHPRHVVSAVAGRGEQVVNLDKLGYAGNLRNVAALKDDRVRRKVQAWNAVANPQMPVPSTATWRAVEQICRERRERAERLHLVGGRS